MSGYFTVMMLTVLADILLCAAYNSKFKLGTSLLWGLFWPIALPIMVVCVILQEIARRDRS